MHLPMCVRVHHIAHTHVMVDTQVDACDDASDHHMCVCDVLHHMCVCDMTHRQMHVMTLSCADDIPGARSDALVFVMLLFLFL